MIYLKHFLAVKIADRIQQLSRERCTGCTSNYILDNFHACIKTPLDERLRLFLPKVRAEALDKLDNLIRLCQPEAYPVDPTPEQTHAMMGVERQCTDFIISLTPDDLQDRRYINEDTVELYPYNMTWLLDTVTTVTTASPPPKQPVKKPAKKSKAVKRKSEIEQMEEQLLAKYSKIEL